MSVAKNNAETIYPFECKTIQGDSKSMSDYRGKVLLIVNTASKCGFTPQYAGLETLHKNYAEQDFAVLGFPCNQFGQQEPGDEKTIQEFCNLTFQTSFPMFEKIEVNGDNAHPLFEFLKTKAPGLLGSKSIKWNFTKFLINRQGNVITRFASKDKPESLTKRIEALL